MNEPRNWKWMICAAFVPALYVVAVALKESFDRSPILLAFQCANLVLMLIFSVAAIANFRNYFGWEETQRFKLRQEALNTTPVTLLANSLKQMHPEAVKVLDRFGVRTSWQVMVGRGPEDLDYILLDTNVHMGFVEYFLEKSNTISVMTKRTLSEGAYHFDPIYKLVKDYEQYDQFLAWLQGRMMITRPFGNVASQWIPPWGPQALMQVMGLTEREHEFDRSGIKELSNDN